MVFCGLLLGVCVRARVCESTGMLVGGSTGILAGILADYLVSFLRDQWVEGPRDRGVEGFRKSVALESLDFLHHERATC